LNNREYLFTSESVSEGHPDKVCDRISDAILDAILSKDNNARVACETMASSKKVIISGEITTKLRLSDDFYIEAAKKALDDIGYNTDESGFNCNKVDIEVNVVKQSSDIAMGLSQKNKSNQGAGDQGLMFGFACNETSELMPLPIQLSQRLAKKMADLRKSGELGFLQPDSKSQVTVKYRGYEPIKIDKVVMATQHNDMKKTFGNNIKKEQGFIKDAIIDLVIIPVLSDYNLPLSKDYVVNGTGRFVSGGPGADTGLTGRKIIVDTYGGYARHGGGAFSGKDPSKVDRSAAYMARYVAKQIVASGLSSRCEVQLAYSIGIAEPVSVFVDTFGTGKISDHDIQKLVISEFDFRPNAIIKKLNLKRPIYTQLTSYGHFGRNGLPWEKISKNSKFFKKAKEHLLWKIM